MRKILNPDYKEKMLLQADETLNRNQNSEYIKKVLAVQSFFKDMPVRIIASCFGVTERTVHLWVNVVIEKGYSALERKKGSGRPAKLNEWQIDYVRELIVYSDPALYDPAAKDWTGRLLSRVIKVKENIDISERWCNAFLKKGGYKTPFHTEQRKQNYKEMERLKSENSRLSEENKELKRKNNELKTKNKELREKLREYTRKK